ncbi:MAG: carboxymuconolactone decarboxylase family protein [Candidatus Dadabacteria bacterium]|nr:carboxymuconolactone decarboxylase family protein [Candidatus Dadabacteria bacterium]
MAPRMQNPAVVVPGAMQALFALGTAAKKAGVPMKTLYMVYLRASQINGCGFCVDMHSREMKRAGEPDERIFGVAAWRESPYFTDEERAALALAEAVTRINDREDAVPDDVWNEAARYYDETGLGALIVNIGLINFWNRVNVATRQPAGAQIPVVKAKSGKGLAA